jgi:uncharacterized protein YbjT (DUF2867 family)
LTSPDLHFFIFLDSFLTRFSRLLGDFKGMKPERITALLVGSTGLVGSQILKQLLSDDRIERVKTFSRRRSGADHPKLQEFIVGFNSMEDWQSDLSGDVLFSALGTTRAQAGSIEAQRIVDYDYQFHVAQKAKGNGVWGYVLISSAHASPQSQIPYSRMKGELERDALALSFERIRILRPGPLKGHRDKPRPMEQFALGVLKWLPQIPGLETLVPVAGERVAHVGIESIFDDSNVSRILEPKDILNYTG